MSIYKVTKYKEDLTEDWGTIFEADSLEESAEKYIERCHYRDPTSVDDECDVFVLSTDGTIKKFNVTRRVDITFNAKEVADE